MIDGGPSILVVDGDWNQRSLLVSLLCEAGFAVTAVADEPGAMDALAQTRFAAAVVALRDGDGVSLLRRARRRQPGLKALLVVEPEALRMIDLDSTALVKRPFDTRQLLGCVFALVLHEDEQEPTPADHHAAEFGIAAAKLVCLQNRRIAAAAAGAHRLAHELAQQIEMASLGRGFAAAAV